MDSIPQKRCNKCGDKKPLTPEYFHRANNTRDGYYSICKLCKCPPKREKLPDGMRRCNACKEILELNDGNFYPSKIHKSGFEYICKSCESMRGKEYRDAHPGARDEYQKEWYIENREVKLAQSKAYYYDTIDYQRSRKRKYYITHRIDVLKSTIDYHKKHPERSRELGKIRRANHPELTRFYNHKRRSLHVEAEGYHTKNDLLMLFEAQKGHCAYCNCVLDTEAKRAIHLDHIQPLSRGGSNWPSNLAYCCRGCNLSKGNKTLEEWQEMKRKYNES